jgi:uroporphyrinogen decarboxylase
MKPVERLEAVFRFEEPDRVPLYDKLRNSGAIAHYAGEPFTYERGNELGLRACRAILDATANPYYPQAEYIDRLDDGFVWKRERWTSWIIERPFHDLDGLARWVGTEIERHEGFDPQAGGAIEKVMQSNEQWQKKLGDCVYLWGAGGIGLHGAFHAAGLEQFCYLLADQPELVARWLDAIFQANCRMLAAYDRRRILHPYVMLGEDIASKTATIFSPAFLRQEFFPRVRTMVGMYHELGCKVIYHSDGNLNAVMDDLVAAEIDGINPIETQAGMDLRDIKARYGKRLVIVGGLDASELLPLGSVDEVRRGTRAALAAAAPGSGYVLGSTTELSNGIPWQNIVAMWDTALQDGRYPLNIA